MSALLEISGVEAGYGASQVLFGVNLNIAEGDVVTLLGRNGMGKTTTVRAVLGLVRVSAGSIVLAGERVNGWAPDRIARRGVAVVPEGRQIFPNLTVEENLAAFATNRTGAREPWTSQRVFGLFPRLAQRRRHMGNELSGGEQQMLAIGRALVTNPRLLILDEATEGLAPLIREEIWRCLRGLAGSGQTILIIDKYVERLIALAGHHTILERGRVVWAGTSEGLSQDHGLWHRYLGL
jgi:branched-chain amino acid transport system ATP-binding protein